MKTSAQQRAAALRRHARTAEARNRLRSELTESFPRSPHRHDLAAFASAQRRRVAAWTATLNEALGLHLKPSTIRTWLREWRKAPLRTPAI